MNNKRVNILGCYVDSLTMEQTLQRIEDIIALRSPTQHVVVNAAKIVMMHDDPELMNIINGCPIINADGQSVVWASKILGDPLPERVAGIDIMFNLIRISASKGYRIFLLGARDDVVARVADTLKVKYPTLQIVGYRNGYFSEDENDAVIAQINASDADILFVGISSPKKEYWLARNLNKLNVPFCMGVGGSFDVIAQVTKRAPLWMQKAGLEWLYRFIQEPKRMWKRILYGNGKFSWLLLKEIVAKRRALT